MMNALDPKVPITPPWPPWTPGPFMIPMLVTFAVVAYLVLRKK